MLIRGERYKKKNRIIETDNRRVDRHANHTGNLILYPYNLFSLLSVISDSKDGFYSQKSVRRKRNYSGYYNRFFRLSVVERRGKQSVVLLACRFRPPGRAGLPPCAILIQIYCLHSILHYF